MAENILNDVGEDSDTDLLSIVQVDINYIILSYMYPQFLILTSRILS